MALNLLVDVLAACGAPQWAATKDAVDLVVEGAPVSLDILRKLEEAGVYAENLFCPSAPRLQADFDSGKPGEVLPGGKFRLRLPRIVNQCVVAKDLADMLSISTAAYQAPSNYFLFCAEDTGKPFCYTGPVSLSAAPPSVRRYHDAIGLWAIIEAQAEHSVTSTRNALFFGIRRTEIAPRFSTQDLAEDIAVREIRDFVGSGRDSKRNLPFGSVRIPAGSKARSRVRVSAASEFLVRPQVKRGISNLPG